MTGEHNVKLITKNLEYELDIKRNITIIRGDSASGKSLFIKLLSLYIMNRKSSGVKVICDKTCVVLTEFTSDGGYWEDRLRSIHDSIIFIDEAEFITSKRFAAAVSKSDNYFVISYREDLEQLPYSVSEIYEFKVNRNKSTYERTYNELSRLYKSSNSSSSVSPTLVITEDSKAGFEFFSAVCIKCGIKCISAYGKRLLFTPPPTARHWHPILFLQLI